MDNPVVIIENNEKFTPYYFYNKFIKRVAQFYRINEDSEIEFILSQDAIADTGIDCYIDPISLPLIISLAEQLKTYHGNPIYLQLIHTHSTLKVLEFLQKSDFFHLVGKNTNQTYPLGLNILKFDENYLGGLPGKKHRYEHKVRGYMASDSGFDFNEYSKLDINGKKNKRDEMVEHYSILVEKHFYTILNQDEFNDSKYIFINILSELITNGVLHSKSNVYALMFSDRFSTKFSISDNGIGLYQSLSEKEVDESNESYSKLQLYDSISKKISIPVSDSMKHSISSIFEALYFSMLKIRFGLFDLMCEVVINHRGRFRLHNENAQIIVSSRMSHYLTKAYNNRNQLVQTYNEYRSGSYSDSSSYKEELKLTSMKCKESLENLIYSILKYYDSDVRFSSLRFYEVKFRGVHIEVEMPNQGSNQ